MNFNYHKVRKKRKSEFNNQFRPPSPVFSNSLPLSLYFPPKESGNMSKYVKMHASTYTNICTYVPTSNSTYTNILTFNITQD